MITAMLIPILTCAMTSPNILLIHVDDLGWQDTGVAMTGQATAQNESVAYTAHQSARSRRPGIDQWIR